MLGRPVHREQRSSSARPRGIRRPLLGAEQLEARTLLSITPIPLDFVATQAVVAHDPSSQTISYSFTVTEPSRLEARFATTLGDTRLSLLTSEGRVLVQSEGLAPDGRDDHLDLHLPGSALGTPYVLRVEALGGHLAAGTLIVDRMPATAPFRHLPVGNTPWGELGDVDDDGILDLVTANYTSNDVSVLLGRGDGTFAPEVRYVVGAGPNDVLIADLNGDGVVDLATPNYEDASLSILAGRGDGTFEPQRRLSLGVVPSSLTTGDFDGDTRVDLAFADFATNEVVLLLGDGQGGYAAPRSLAVGASPYDVTCADFDHDGILDLVTANYTSNDVSLLLGQGDGSFSLALTLPVGEAPYAVRPADLDGDRHLDLVTANTNSGDLTVWFGKGDGTFDPSPLTLPAGAGASVTAVADLDEDGRLDLVATNFYAATLSIYLNAGGRQFQNQPPLLVGSNPWSIAAADLNRDGHVDLVHSNYADGDMGVALGRGNGTFAIPGRLEQGVGIESVASGDLDRDGRLDLISVNYGTGDVQIMLGRADGTFQTLGRYANGSDPASAILGDFTGDGVLDLVLGNFSTSDVSLSVGRGDGTFDESASFATGSIPSGLATGDFNGDGHLDLAVATAGSNRVDVLLGDGQGSLLPGGAIQTGEGPSSLGRGDLDGDGLLDLVTTNRRSGTVSVLFGMPGGGFAATFDLVTGGQPSSVVVGDLDGDQIEDLAVTDEVSDQVVVFLSRPATPGRFTGPARFDVGQTPTTLVIGHFDRDEYLDLATTDREDDCISILLGDGQGGFAQVARLDTGHVPDSLVAGDLDGNGLQDLVVGNFASSDLSIYLGEENGLFQGERRTPIASGAVDLATGDFDGDGFLDAIGVSFLQDGVYVELGTGDFRSEAVRYFPAGDGAIAATTGDFNRDGRLDLAIANLLASSVSILPGLGDGSFGLPVEVAVGYRPRDLLAVDLDGNGVLDLAVANSGSGDVSVLLGRGDGSFQTQVRFVAGPGIVALQAADVDGDGRVDLVTANEQGRSVSVLRGLGAGVLAAPLSWDLPASPTSLALGDFDGDNRPDLVMASKGGDLVQVWLNDGGTFHLATQLASPGGPSAVALGDFDRDGFLDLAASRLGRDDYLVWLGKGDGTFLAEQSVSAGQYPTDLLAVDVDVDGRLDLFGINGLGEPGTVNLGHGDGTFTDHSFAPPPLRNTPLAADIDRDGRTDVFVLQQSGRILARMGEGDRPGTFAPPILVNPDASLTARDVALVSVHGATMLAAIDARDDALSLYAFDPVGRTFVRRMTLAIPAAMPARLLAGDLDDDHRDDLAVATASGRLFVFRQDAGGAFTLTTDEVEISGAPSDLALLRVPGDGPAGSSRPALAVLDAVAGSVRLLVAGGATQAGGLFGTNLEYRAGHGLTTVVEVRGKAALVSREEPMALVPGFFDGDGLVDLAVLQRGAHRLDLLRGSASGGMLDPRRTDALPSGKAATALVSGDFNRDGLADLIALDGDGGGLTIYLADGRGSFGRGSSVGGAGDRPSGLATQDLDGDGKLDLLVGNRLGDVLVLLGNGDGSFAPYRRVDRHLALAVADLDGDGRDDFLFANQGMDRISVRYSRSGPGFAQDRFDGIRDPGSVRLADLDGDGERDLVVVNGGGNEVLVYPGRPGGQFGAPHRFYAGTSPHGVAIADLNGDGRLDLAIANEGSNDVSILLGHGLGEAWSLLPGPRLRAGLGPVSVLVRDLDGDGIPDLLACNAGSSDVYQLTGVGGGFFDDRAPRVFHTGQTPSNLAVGQFDAQPGLDLVTLDTAAGELSFFSGMAGVRQVRLAGTDPTAFLAGDFDHDGLDDLVILGHRDSTLSLLMGSFDGPRLAATLTSVQVLHPIDLALAEMADGSLDLYVMNAEEQVGRLSFALGLDPILTPVETTTPMGPPISTFSSLGRSLLESVATLLLAPGDAEETAAIRPAVHTQEVGPATESIVPASGGNDEREVPTDLPEEGPAASPAELDAFVLGVDELPFEQRLLEHGAGADPVEEDLEEQMAPWPGDRRIMEEASESIEARPVEAESGEELVGRQAATTPAWSRLLALLSLLAISRGPLVEETTIRERKQLR